MFGFEIHRGRRAFVRYFQKFSMEDNAEVFSYWYKWFFGNLAFINFTLDLEIRPSAFSEPIPAFYSRKIFELLEHFAAPISYIIRMIKMMKS
jgi:hypothetical protein